jgi:3-oxoacyl-[acyl-carrier protein] reductase
MALLVTINNLLPGMFGRSVEEQQRRAARRKARQPGKYLARMNSIGRPFGNPDEFGAACAFLCVANGQLHHGHELFIDGGVYPGTF